MWGQHRHGVKACCSRYTFFISLSLLHGRLATFITDHELAKAFIKVTDGWETALERVVFVLLRLVSMTISTTLASNRNVTFELRKVNVRGFFDY